MVPVPTAASLTNVQDIFVTPTPPSSSLQSFIGSASSRPGSPPLTRFARFLGSISGLTAYGQVNVQDLQIAVGEYNTLINGASPAFFASFPQELRYVRDYLIFLVEEAELYQ
jgi:hypothetical protein